MKKSIKRIAVVASAVTLVAVVAGCSQRGPIEVDLGDGPPVAGTVKANALDGVPLTLVSWGGMFQDGQVAAASDPFAKESGATMLSDGPTEYSKVKAQVDSNNVSWDIVDSDTIWAASQCGEDGLLQPLDLDIVDVSNIPDGLVGECYVPAMQYGYIIMYNEDKYGDNPPTGWADFFDTENFPGKRGIAGFEDIGPGVYEGVLLADGVAADDLYPLDMDRVYEKLDEVRDSFIFWTTGAESQQMIESGEADMALVWSGRGYEAVVNGAPYKPIWNQGLVVSDALGVPKNAKNPDAAFAYINYYLGAKQQAKLTELTSYSPVHVGSKPNLDELASQYLVTSPEIAPQVIATDSNWWGDNYDEQLSVWLEWLRG